jgi:hypothetical protein
MVIKFFSLQRSIDFRDAFQIDPWRFIIEQPFEILFRPG